MSRALRRRLRLVLPGLIALAGCGRSDQAPSPDATPPVSIGLYSSLPIAWNESADLRGLLDSEARPHWALAVLRNRGRLLTLDTLARLHLPADGVLILAQPRPLTPRENVALDAWVGRGGRVLLLADPMLTAHSLFGAGDPRRPQDIAMLSPILRRWGLILEFDDMQPASERVVQMREGPLPVSLPGRFRVSGNSRDQVRSGKTGGVVARCRLEADGLLAECTAGKGRIVALADAAVLENVDDPAEMSGRALILSGLLDRLFTQNLRGHESFVTGDR